MMKNRQKVNYDAILNSILLVAGIIILGVIVVVVTRFQKGLLAFVLSALAGGLLIFWLFELKRTFKQSATIGKAQERKWTYDLISSDDEITLVAEVPWPDDNVSVQLEKGRLKVRSSKDFAKEIELSDQVELIGSTCVNGILNVRLRRIGSKR